MNKITIIGAGQVGSTIAYALTLRQLASEILLIDIDKDRAKGEAMDIYQGTDCSASDIVPEKGHGCQSPALPAADLETDNGF